MYKPIDEDEMYESLPEGIVATADAYNSLQGQVLDAVKVPQAADDEQEAAIRTLLDEPFADLSGTAGVGKTYVARLLAERAPGLVLTATTGIAAVNLGEGTTINSLLEYYDTNSLKEKFLTDRLRMKLKRLRDAGLRKILLDEKSMLDGNQLTYLVRAIDEVNSPKELENVGMATEEEDEAVAGIADLKPTLGLILVGDFGQLPPVKAPFAFESPEWYRFAEHRVALKTIRRQTDHDFIHALHQIRMGNAIGATDYFTETKFSDATDDHFEGTTIFAKNDAVDRYNQLRMDEITGAPVSFHTERWGKQASEWGKIENDLTLKIGALVMVLANRRTPMAEGSDIIYCNGDLGELVDTGVGTSFDRNGHPRPTRCALVRLQRTGEVEQVNLVTREQKVPLEPGRRKELKDQGRSDLVVDKYEVIGTVTYMPLRLAYASTVHKTQGLTLDHVQVNIHDSFFGAPSMLFVALSRARTPQGLRIVGTQRTFVARCSVNSKVVPWL